jgi:hypothetical protein
MPTAFICKEVSLDFMGFHIICDVRDAGYEGDPSVPNGTRWMGWELDGLTVYAMDDEEVTHWLTDDAIKHITNHIWYVIDRDDLLMDDEELRW